MAKRTRATTTQNDGWQDIFEGTGAIYTLDSEGCQDSILGDYLVEAMPETWPEQYRARRLHLAAKGRRLPRLPANALHDKVLVAFGPLVSAADAVLALQRIITGIKESGLLIGRVHAGDMVWEQTDGSLKSG